MYQVKSGPLPSASGGRQTPLPINIKWGNKVQVLLQKQEKSTTPDIWFPEEGLGIETLARVNELHGPLCKSYTVSIQSRVRKVRVRDS